MRTEIILKRPTGEKVKINVSVYLDDFRTDKAVYTISVSTLPKGKRNWNPVHSSDDYQWRSLNSDQRLEYEMKIYLEYVSMEEILEAKLALWNLLKPI